MASEYWVVVRQVPRQAGKPEQPEIPRYTVPGNIDREALEEAPEVAPEKAREE